MASKVLSSVKERGERRSDCRRLGGLHGAKGWSGAERSGTCTISSALQVREREAATRGVWCWRHRCSPASDGRREGEGLSTSNAGAKPNNPGQGTNDSGHNENQRGGTGRSHFE